MQRRVVRAVADVHHHLGHVDRPALGEQAAAEDRPDDRRAAVRVDALEVVARAPPRGWSAAGASGRCPRAGSTRAAPRDQSSGIGVIAKNAFWPLSSGPGDDSIAPPNERRKTGVQLDLERLVGEADEVALAAERLDPGVLLAAEVEQVVGLRVLGGDGVEDAADERLLVVRAAAARAARSARARARAGPSRPGPRTYSRSAAARIRSGVSVVGAHRVAHLLGEQRRAEAALAVARGQDDVAQVGLEGGHGGPRGRGRRVEPRRQGGDGGSVAAAASAAASASAISSSMPGRAGAARSRSGTAPTGRPACPTSVVAGGVEHRRQRLQPPGGRRQPVGERRELAGREREQALADEVDPVERVPGVLAQRPSRRTGTPRARR